MRMDTVSPWDRCQQPAWRDNERCGVNVGIALVKGGTRSQQLRRREFGSAATWPLAAQAQQLAKLPTIGILRHEHAFGLGKLPNCRRA